MAARFDEERLAVVEAAMVGMESDHSIERRLAREYKCTPKRVRSWIAEIRRRWLEREQNTTPDEHRAFVVAQMLHLLGMAKKEGHTNAARELLRDLAKIWNLTTTEASSVVHHVFSRNGAYTSPQAINERLRELRALQGGDDDKGSGGAN